MIPQTCLFTKLSLPLALPSLSLSHPPSPSPPHPNPQKKGSPSHSNCRASLSLSLSLIRVSIWEEEHTTGITGTRKGRNVEQEVRRVEDHGGGDQRAHRQATVAAAGVPAPAHGQGIGTPATPPKQLPSSNLSAFVLSSRSLPKGHPYVGETHKATLYRERTVRSALHTGNHGNHTRAPAQN